jgi:ABC-2 type transport system permease protein
MSSLLAIEWLKLKRYNTFWILIFFFVVLLPLWNYCILSGAVNIGGNGIKLLNQTYSFPGVWGNIGFWGSLFLVLLSILIIILTANEFTFRTQRQNVIDGWSRLQFYHAKILLVIVFSLAATLYVFILGAIFGYANSGSFNSMFDGMEKVFYFFLFSLNYLGFALLTGILIRRSGLSIGMFLLYIFIVKNILKGILNYTNHDWNIGNYLPLQSSSELLPFPLFEMFKGLMKQSPQPFTLYVSASIAWAIVYYFAGRQILLKRDW